MKFASKLAPPRTPPTTSGVSFALQPGLEVGKRLVGGRHLRFAAARRLAASGRNQLGYDISYMDGALSVTQAPLTLAAVTQSKVYDGNTGSTGVVGVTGLMTGDSLTGVS